MCNSWVCWLAFAFAFCVNAMVLGLLLGQFIHIGGRRNDPWDLTMSITLDIPITEFPAPQEGDDIRVKFLAAGAIWPDGLTVAQALRSGVLTFCQNVDGTGTTFYWKGPHYGHQRPQD